MTREWGGEGGNYFLRSRFARGKEIRISLLLFTRARARRRVPLRRNPAKRETHTVVLIDTRYFARYSRFGKSLGRIYRLSSSITRDAARARARDRSILDNTSARRCVLSPGNAKVAVRASARVRRRSLSAPVRLVLSPL